MNRFSQGPAHHPIDARLQALRHRLRKLEQQYLRPLTEGAEIDMDAAVPALDGEVDALATELERICRYHPGPYCANGLDVAGRVHARTDPVLMRLALLALAAGEIDDRRKLEDGPATPVL